MKKGLYIMDKVSFHKVYPQSVREEIESYAVIDFPPMDASEALDQKEKLEEVSYIFTGWGAPLLDEGFLEAAPSLEAVFFGAGSVKHIITPEFWTKKIKMTSAYAANAIPVSEFTIAQILFSLKKGWYYISRIRKEKKIVTKIPVPGAFRSTVGLVSLGMIGRRVAELLQSFDLEVLAYDPFVSREDAEKLGIRLVTLEELFIQSDVISLHTPWLKETEGMIDGSLFRKMKEGATFINTARGAVVNEEDLIEVFNERSDLTALLDVTHPEPPVDGSPLYEMENVLLTPHLAGSMDRECGRMGRYMVEELKRFVKGDDLKWEITEAKAAILA